MAGTVVRVPNQDARNRGIHSRSHEERHPIFDLGVGNADISNYSIANNRWDKGEEHDDSTNL